ANTGASSEHRPARTPRACASWDRAPLRARGNQIQRLCQPVLERVELVLDAGGQLLADELEPLLDQRQLLAPLLGIHRQRLGYVVGIDVESVQVQVLDGGHNADRRVLSAGSVLD